jgi:hypothetical protein
MYEGVRLNGGRLFLLALLLGLGFAHVRLDDLKAAGTMNVKYCLGSFKHPKQDKMTVMLHPVKSIIPKKIEPKAAWKR